MSVIACYGNFESRSGFDAAKVAGMNKLLLVFCALVGVMFGQDLPKKPASGPLKEYSYPPDGFAIKLPYAVESHTDSINPDFKVWTIHLGKDAGISVRMKMDSQPCDLALDKLKSMAKAKNISIREFTVSGRPAWEEKEWPSGDRMVFERYVCGEGRYYLLTLGWPGTESRPHLGVEIMDSFRLLK